MRSSAIPGIAFRGGSAANSMCATSGSLSARTSAIGHWCHESMEIRCKGSHPSLRQAGFAHAFGNPVSRGDVAKGLSFDPIANPEMRISREIEFALLARLVQPAELRQGRGQ